MKYNHEKARAINDFLYISLLGWTFKKNNSKGNKIHAAY